MQGYKYTLDKSSKKFLCPKCGKKRMVRYIETETGEYAPDNFGRCDREQECGYYLYPKTEGEYTRSPTVTATPKIVLPSFHKKSDMEAALNLTVLQSKNFYRFFTRFFYPAAFLEALDLYKIGTSKNFDVVYWQIDGSDNIRAGKAIRYDTNGRRSKDDFSLNWVHKLLKIEDFNLVQVLFGTHLLKKDTLKPVAICEGEKTAFLMSIFEPDYIWLACGGKSNLANALRNTKELAGRDVVLYPDKGCEAEWLEIAKQIHHLRSVKVEDWDTKNEMQPGDDVLDIQLLHIEQRKEYVKKWLSENPTPKNTGYISNLDTLPEYEREWRRMYAENAMNEISEPIEPIEPPIL